jgi:predicted MPP superfamily phosphohydrolase
MRTVLRWVHLSDIHFKWSDKLDQESGLRQIEKDIETKKKSGWAPDLIFITGDLANAGYEDEYAIINEFLEKLRKKLILPKSHFFFCPGNHDVNRDLRPFLFAGCVARLKDESETDKFLNSPEYKNLLERQAAYWNFVENFYGKSNETSSDDKKLHYYRNVNIDEMQVSVYALNSSWLSFGGQHDRGRLLVGARNLENFLGDSPTDPVNLSVALIHHPFEWLAPFEADHIESIACRKFDLILRGHVHRPRLAQINVETANAILLTAGATFEGSIRNYEYSYGSLDIPESKVTVHNSIYLTSRNRWSEETRICNFNRLGSRDHNLGVVEQKLKEICGSVSSPSHISTLLAGVKADMAFELHNVVGFHSPNLTGSSEASHIIAAVGVMKVKALLDFYGDGYVDSLLSDHRDNLLAYDDYLTQNAQKNPHFAEGLRQREKEARSFVNDSIDIDSEPPFIIISLRRSVVEGNLKSFKKYLELAKRLNKSDISKFARSLEEDLPEKDEDICLYEVWKKSNGDERFTFKEFSSLLVELMTKGRLGLAGEVLLRCTKTFPKDSSRYLTDMARNIASEAGNKNIFLKFEQLTKT